jgi:YesN/AraC family two-component response regulator
MTDYRMPGKEGAQLIKEIFEINPSQTIILATAYGAEYAQLGTSDAKVLLDRFLKKGVE